MEFLQDGKIREKQSNFQPNPEKKNHRMKMIFVAMLY